MIPDSFAEYLGPVAASISPALVSADTFSAMSQVARMVPGALASNTFGFESRLGEDGARADFLTQATAAHGRTSLARLPYDDFAPSAWARVTDFASGWNGRSPLLSREVDNVWLEFDLDGPRPDEPSAFFGFRPTAAAPDVLGPASGTVHLTATLEAVGVLRGREVTTPSFGALRSCFDALPGSAEVFQVGVMLSRPQEVVRLCVRLRSVEDAMRYLQLVGWRGDESQLRLTFEPVGSLADYVTLDVDVGSSVQPRVGMECYVDSPDRWTPLLGHLLSVGLCTEGKWSSLLDYPGHVTETQASAPWPRTLTEVSNLLGPRSLSFFVRWLHHIKVVHHPDGAAEAKAYLAVDYRWRALAGGDKE